MALTYINTEGFNNQLTEKKLSIETLAEILGMEIRTANIIFSGHKSISDFEILKLHELAGFSYANLLTKRKKADYAIRHKRSTPLEKYKPTNDRELRKTLSPINQSTICEECKFLIITPVNYCEYCGTALPQFINQPDIELIKNKPTDEFLYLNNIAFNTRINLLQVSIDKVYKQLNVNQSDFIQIITGKKAILEEEQKILSELLSAPIGYFAGSAIE